MQEISYKNFKMHLLFWLVLDIKWYLKFIQSINISEYA